jgi:hypothetical protein
VLYRQAAEHRLAEVPGLYRQAPGTGRNEAPLGVYLEEGAGVGGQIPEVELLLPMLGAERERHRISGIQYNVRNVLHYIPISG